MGKREDGARRGKGWRGGEARVRERVISSFVTRSSLSEQIAGVGGLAPMFLEEDLVYQVLSNSLSRIIVTFCILMCNPSCLYI